MAVLEKLGFYLSRQSRSHKIYKNTDGKRATIPFHANQTLHPKILKSIIKDAEITAVDLKKLL
ncbi:MAG: type II toxin-antitoxin system HicA family toxin [bacterium]|nr:type II toxin-antitoxin system HicA family toxin [bacterium]